MKANPEKCHVILNSNTQNEICFENASIASSLSKKNTWDNFWIRTKIWKTYQ